MRRLATILKVQGEEGQLVAWQAGLIFFVSSGGAIGGSAIEALFYSHFGAEYLPYLYMLVSGITFIVLMGMTALTARVSRTRLYQILPLALALILVVNRIILGFNFNWFYPVLWLSMSVIGTVQGLYVWGLAGSIVDVRQAKRLFPLFGASVILGAIVGGFLTAPLARWLQTENLILIWAVALLIAFALGRGLIRRAPPRPGPRRRSTGPLEQIRSGYRFVRSSRLLRWIVVSGVLFSILAYSLALPFARAAAAEFPDADRLAGFLGIFQGITTTAALLMSLLVANRLYVRWGLMTARLGLPVIYLLGFGVLMAVPSFPAVVVFRFMEQLWSQGISSAAYQALFNVVPSQQRDQTRMFISAVPDQLGTFAAGLILVVGQQMLTPQALYLLGLLAALLVLLVVWQQKRAYAAALVAALRDGQPQVFFSEEEPFGGLQRDAAALATVQAGLSSSDASVRRISIEILGHLSVPEANDALTAALQDPDFEVRVLALQAVAYARVSTALIEVAACLDDPQPEVRAEAVETLRHMAGHGRGVVKLIRPLLDDEQPVVRARAAAALLHLGERTVARDALRAMLKSHETDVRLEALRAWGASGDPAANEWIAVALADPLPRVRHAAAQVSPALISDSLAAGLIRALSDADSAVRTAVAAAIGRVGPTMLDATVAALSDPALEHGALAALEFLPVQPAAHKIRHYASINASRALRHHHLQHSIQLNGDERLHLLADALHDAARRQAINALRAIGLISDRDIVATAIDNLSSRMPDQRANAIETLEAIGEHEIVRPLLTLWESGEAIAATELDWRTALLDDVDPWLRDCAWFAQSESHRLGDETMHTLPTLSLMERVLFLRHVPLFADLAPQDLKHIAALVDERLFHATETIAQQGEPGDELFIIVSGEVAVLEGAAGQVEREITRRHAGEVVGEMSIIAQEPRIASLIAVGPVRVLSVNHQQFESMLRERPEISLAVMRVLIARLKEQEARQELTR